jgi:DNA repair photolyase
VRWENLQLEAGPQARADTATPLIERSAVARTFDTPEFRGMTFYEIHARSILNRVPAASRMPFEWTINVYRGCAHACPYCLSGDTPILMADGRVKPLSRVRVGDAVYGTVVVGRHRRYVATRVLAHWETVKPGYRVTLTDGTQLVASADHRFLTDRGWKHVAGAPGGPRRPYLTTNNMLVGTGRFAAPPREGDEYRRGYLCGILRGPGQPSPYTAAARGPALREVHPFRRALVDIEALRRVRGYLRALEVSRSEFVFQERVGARKPIVAIRTATDGDRAALEAALGWPRAPSTEWAKGFLAGIFDAEGGSLGDGVPRISTTDPAAVEQVTACLRRLDFAFAVEAGGRPRPVTHLRLRGGTGEHLRFLLAVDPAISRKRTIEGQPLRSRTALRVASVEPLGADLALYDITTGTGDFIADGVVAHNCFARPSHTYLDLNSGADFERKIVVKVNAPQVLRRELGRPSWRGAHVAMGTNTDPYQRCEGRYRLTRGVLEVLRDFRNPCSVLTKSPLLTRDLELFAELADTAGFSANLSIGTLDEQVWRRVEPGTPHPRARLAAVRRLRQAGISCGVLVAPILPHISDSPDQLRSVARAAAEAGATQIVPITLHLRRGVKEEFMPWLAREYPELVTEYRRLYPGSNAPLATQQAISERVEAGAGSGARAGSRSEIRSGSGSVQGSGRASGAGPGAGGGELEGPAAPVQLPLL